MSNLCLESDKPGGHVAKERLYIARLKGNPLEKDGSYKADILNLGRGEAVGCYPDLVKYYGCLQLQIHNKMQCE